MGGGPPGASADTLPQFECPKETEEPCFTGRQCFKSKLKCDGGEPDCADGSDESTLVCSSIQTTKDGGKEAAGSGGKDGGGGDTDTWVIVGAVLGIVVCGIATHLYINGCTCKACEGAGDEPDEPVEAFSLSFSNPAYSKGGELAGRAVTTYANSAVDQSYMDMGPANGASYINVVDGDDGGYMLTSATGDFPNQDEGGAYDTDFTDGYVRQSTKRPTRGDSTRWC